MLFYPDMAPFRADPRFGALADALGLTEDWIGTQRLPDMCSGQEEISKCDDLGRNIR